MPWTTKDARKKNSKIRSDGEARMWVRVANKARKARLAEGADEEDADAYAIKAANKAVREMHRKGGPTLSMADKPHKTEDGQRFPAAAYAYVPDSEKPSTWKLRLWATPSGGPDTAIVGAAIAALGKGFRGRKVQIPSGDLAAVKAKVRAAWKKANPKKKPEDMPPVIRASRSGRAYILFSPDTGSFLSLGQKQKRGGVSVYRYRKEVIKVGNYVKSDEGLRFSVTPETLKHWVLTFRKMHRNGVAVTVPLGHENDGDPEKNLGEVEDLFIDGNALVGVFALKGDDAPRLAESNDVSLYVPPVFTDGRGNPYKRPICHIALTPVPVIPGLGKWERLAASLTPETEPDTMAIDLKKLQADLGIEAELTEKNAAELILAAHKQLGDRVAELEKEVAGLKLSRDKPEAKLDPLLLKLGRENRAMKLDVLVEAAKITPAVRDKLAEQYATDETLALSLSRGGDNFDELVAALAENDPVELGEKSGPQIMRLDRGSEDKNLLVEDAKRRVEAAKAS